MLDALNPRNQGSVTPIEAPSSSGEPGHERGSRATPQGLWATLQLDGGAVSTLRQVSAPTGPCPTVPCRTPGVVPAFAFGRRCDGRPWSDRQVPVRDSWDAAPGSLEGRDVARGATDGPAAVVGARRLARPASAEIVGAGPAPEHGPLLRWVPVSVPPEGAAGTEAPAAPGLTPGMREVDVRPVLLCQGPLPDVLLDSGLVGCSGSPVAPQAEVPGAAGEATRLQLSLRCAPSLVPRLSVMLRYCGPESVFAQQLYIPVRVSRVGTGSGPPLWLQMFRARYSPSQGQACAAGRADKVPHLLVVPLAARPRPQLTLDTTSPAVAAAMRERASGSATSPEGGAPGALAITDVEVRWRPCGLAAVRP
jgi:hypothetical protein